MPVLCFFLGRRFRTTVFGCLLVTLFPLSDGGGLVDCCDYLCGVERWWILFGASVECGLPFGLVAYDTVSSAVNVSSVQLKARMHAS
jgi:hypothetical protein